MRCADRRREKSSGHQVSKFPRAPEAHDPKATKAPITPAIPAWPIAPVPVISTASGNSVLDSVGVVFDLPHFAGVIPAQDKIGIGCLGKPRTRKQRYKLTKIRKGQKRQ